jgi:hypothetical protein
MRCLRRLTSTLRSSEVTRVNGHDEPPRPGPVLRPEPAAAEAPVPAAPAAFQVAQPQPPAALAPQAPPKKKGRRRRIVLAVVFAGLALGGFRVWQASQAYDNGHAAYLAADCATAVGFLRQAGGDGRPSSSDSETEKNARAELQECEAFLAAGDLKTQGKPAAALLAFRDFIVAHPRSPLVDSARSAATGLGAAAAAAATTALCDEIDSLETMSLLGTPPSALPELLFECGNAYGAAAQWQDALLMYARFRSEFPDHALAEEVEAAFAAATLADAEAGGAGELAPPPGVEGGDENVATVVIVNDAPDPINIVFSGTVVRVEDVLPCTDCETLTEDPGECPNKGPLVEYELPPGSYTVVVKSGTNVLTTPFRGTWDLAAGFTYEHCFYIVTSG